MQQLAQMNSETYGNTKEMRQPASLEMDTKDAKRPQVLGQITNKLPQIIQEQREMTKDIKFPQIIQQTTTPEQDFADLYKQRVIAAESQLKESQKQLAEKEDQIVKWRGFYNEKQNELDAAKNELVKTKNGFDKWHQTFMFSLNKEREDVKSIISSLRKDNEKKDMDIKKLENDIANLRKTVTNLQQQLGNIQSQNTTLRQQLRARGVRG